MTRDLLTEAIADAKAVKETAIANAKAALEEAFTPHLKSMLAAKLEEMDKDEDIEETITNKEVETVEEIEEVTVTEEEEVEEEINLDELLAELEKGDKEKEEVKESEESEEVTEEEVVEAEEGEDEEAEGEMEEEEIDLEDMTEDDLKSFIEDVIKDMVEAGELEAGEEMESEEEGEEAGMEDEMDIEIEDEVEPGMEEKEELEEDDAVSKKLKDGASLDSAPRKVGQTTVQEDEVKVALAKIEELKNELNEVNLLNAKLLYTNKIFKAKNLSEDKKVKVLKAFDKATTVKEAKVIFETLNEGIISTKSTPMVNEIKGSASKATGTIPAAKQPIVENAAFRRMQQLAGIIKEN